MKRRMDGEQGGSAAKRPRKAKKWTEEMGLEGWKVRALEQIAEQIEVINKWLEKAEGEVRFGTDLATLVYLRDTSFKSIDWAHRVRLAEIATQTGELDIEERWREDQDKGEGSSKRM